MFFANNTDVASAGPTVTANVGPTRADIGPSKCYLECLPAVSAESAAFESVVEVTGEDSPLL